MDDTYIYIIAVKSNKSSEYLKECKKHKEMICRLLLTEMGYNIFNTNKKYNYCEIVKSLFKTINESSKKIEIYECDKILKYSETQQKTHNDEFINFLKDNCKIRGIKNKNGGMNVPIIPDRSSSLYPELYTTNCSPVTEAKKILYSVNTRKIKSNKLLKQEDYISKTENSYKKKKLFINEYKVGDYSWFYKFELGLQSIPSYIVIELVPRTKSDVEKSIMLENLKDLEKIEKNAMSLSSIKQKLKYLVKSDLLNSEKWELLVDALQSNEISTHILVTRKIGKTEYEQYEKLVGNMPSKHDFTAKSPYELNIKCGDYIDIYIIYIDGSVYGQNNRSSEYGYFPITVFI